MIIANQISKSYGDTVVIDGVSVSIPAGGVTSIIGPNGAGKSTLLSIVARLMSMDAGTVTVDGLDVTKTASDTLAKRLSILRQDNHISSRLTVRDLVGFGRYPYSKGRPTIEDKVHIDRALEYLHLEPLAGRFLDELSGGQRQRAFVAMVLCQDTDYVLLDEPLNNLDMKHASSMMKIMRKAADEPEKDRGSGAARHQLRLLVFRHHHRHARGPHLPSRTCRRDHPPRDSPGNLRHADPRQ